MKIPKRFIKSLLVFLCVLLLCVPLTVLAQTKVVVVPLGEEAKPNTGTIHVYDSSEPRQYLGILVDLMNGIFIPGLSLFTWIGVPQTEIIAPFRIDLHRRWKA